MSVFAVFDAGSGAVKGWDCEVVWIGPGPADGELVAWQQNAIAFLNEIKETGASPEQKANSFEGKVYNPFKSPISAEEKFITTWSELKTPQ